MDATEDNQINTSDTSISQNFSADTSSIRGSDGQGIPELATSQLVS